MHRALQLHPDRLFPADPGEAFEMAVQAFDLADRLQTPVMILTDLDIGMNDWMVPELEWDDDYVPDRGKVLGAEELEKIEENLGNVFDISHGRFRLLAESQGAI